MGFTGAQIIEQWRRKLNSRKLNMVGCVIMLQNVFVDS